MKIDLHLHSKHSKRPTQWILQKINCPESFAEPAMLNRLRRKAGMDAVTITDHNTIDGALEIAHLPDAFISEEVTTYFPEDGCKVHVLVYNIDEGIHEDIQKLRENIYDLVGYLNGAGIVHALAHGLFSLNDRLTVDHFEKFVLMFKIFELNGARDSSQNKTLQAVLKSLNRKSILNLADRHDLAPNHSEPQVKFFIGGSDDHSALNVARMYTDVPGSHNIREFLAGVASGRGIPSGRGASPLTLAYNLYGIAYQFYNSKFKFDRFAGQDILMKFLERMLKPEPQSTGWFQYKLRELFTPHYKQKLAASRQLEDVLRREGEGAITEDPELMAILRNSKGSGDKREERWFRFVERVTNKVMHRFGTALYDQLSGGNVLNVFTTIGAAGSLYTMMAPYFISFGLLGRSRELEEQVKKRLLPENNPAVEARVKVAHFTDTFYEVNGVARTLQQMSQLADSLDKDLTVITCTKGPSSSETPRVVNFEAIDTYELPVYREQKLFVPPFLDMLRHVYEQGYTYIHSSTPGPVGLAALAIARILNIPISGTYHTAIPEYASYLTGDENVTGLVWRYTLWYYGQLERVYTPSSDTADMLIQKGLAPDRMVVYPRGVDVERFHPEHRDGFYEKRFQLNRKIKILYTGRVSKEKNMPLLAVAFKKLAATHSKVHLIIVGDGPYLEEMKSELAGSPVTFTGYLGGSDLQESFASADLFVFPSTTDTFGNVILEAQASGLPVIVTDRGGPRENMIPEKTGLIVPADDEAGLVKAMNSMVSNPLKLKQMGKEARKYVQDRSFEKAFLDLWQLYEKENIETGPVWAKTGGSAG